jgi:hypothetical protein
MNSFRKQRIHLMGLPILLLLSGCDGPEPDCNSADTRNSVIKTVSADISNPLVSYAADTSDAVKARLGNATTEAEKTGILEAARRGASYRMSDQMNTDSKNTIKRKVSCSGLLSATVEDTTAQKKVDFEVEQTSDGKMSIWVSPFKFDAPQDPSRPNE